MKMQPEDLMRQNLIAIAQTYATAKGWSLATVSKQIHGNQAFLSEYLAGNMSPRVDTYFTMLGKLRLNWPEGVRWPKTASIPAPAEPTAARVSPKVGEKSRQKAAAA